MKTLTVLAGLGVLAMIAAIIFAFLSGDFAREGRQLLSMPWGVTSLVDLYVGFVLFCAWILFRQGNTAGAWLWTVLVLTLGALAICGYVLYALRSSKGNWDRFFLGRHTRRVA